jgi:hypothetical protein
VKRIDGYEDIARRTDITAISRCSQAVFDQGLTCSLGPLFGHDTKD